MRWIKREEYYSGFCVYMANILAPRWIADIDPFRQFCVLTLYYDGVKIDL